MSALSIAEQCLATNQVSKDFLTKLIEKDFLTEEAVSEILDDSGLTKYLVSEKKKKRSPKKSKISDADRNNEMFNPDKCHCRVWKAIGGIGLPNVQCTRKPPSGETMCKMHAGKVDEGGNWWLGLVTEGLPPEPVYQPGKKKAHWWTDDAKNEADEKKKSSKKKENDVVSDEEDEGPKKKVKKKVKKVKKVKKKVEKVDSDEEDEEDEPKKMDKVESDEENDDGNTPFFFEGVKYIRTEDGDIVNPDNYDLMGEDDGSGGIEWTDDEMAEKHQQLLAELE